MRPHAFFLASIPALALGAAASGCQFIAQLNVLQVEDGGAGGSGGKTTTSTTTSATTTTSSTTSTTTTDASCGQDGGTCMMGGGCPSCSGSTCMLQCDATMCPMTGIPANLGPTTMECGSDGACAGKTFTCSGTYLCELDCNGQNACLGTILNCGTTPCRLNCGMMSCGPGDAGMSTTVNCGDTGCDVQYFAPASAPLPYVQNCGTQGPCCTHHDNGG